MNDSMGKMDKTPKKHVFRAEDTKQVTGNGYPPPFNEIAMTRTKWKVSDHAGLTQYGVNITTLPPGEWSAQRHWHEQEDEFTYILSGELVLITDDGDEIVRAGDMMGFPAGVNNGHHLVNRSDKNAVYMEIGTRILNEVAHYPDVDLHVEMKDGVDVFTRKDGTPLSENT